MATEPTPARLVPRDAADVAAIVAAATRPLEPIGRGSKRQIGKPVDAELLDLGALAGLASYEPAELVLTAAAATPLAAEQPSEIRRLECKPLAVGGERILENRERRSGTGREHELGGLIAR